MRSPAWDGDWPVTQPYGRSDLVGIEPHDPRFPEIPAFHQGIDIGMTVGTAIRAVAAGQVTWADAAGELRITYDNLGGRQRDSWCFHLDAILCSAGTRVTAGDLLARSGAKGHATGPHLHIEFEDGAVFPYGNPALDRPYHSIDPLPFLASPSGGFMSDLTVAEQQEIRDKVRVLFAAFITPGGAAIDPNVYYNVAHALARPVGATGKDLLQLLEELIPKVDSLQQSVGAVEAEVQALKQSPPPPPAPAPPGG